MKIMTLLGYLVLLTTSPMTNSFLGQFIAVPLPILVFHPKPVAGSIFGLLALAVIAFRILLRPLPTNKPLTTIKPSTTNEPSTAIKPSTTNKPSTTIKPSTTNKPPPECPSGYTLNEIVCGRFCYRLESQECKSFENARAACNSDGADLLEPDVCSIPLFRDLANQTEGPRCEDYWVGGFRTLPEVNYKTVRGADLPDNLQFWGEGEPSKSLIDTEGEEACVQMDVSLNYLLSDYFCKSTTGYICQKFL